MDLYGLTDDVIISKNAGAKIAKKDGQKIIPKHIQKLTKLLEVNDLEDDPGQEQSEARIRPGSIFHEFMIDFTQSPNFSRFIMSCILLNSVLLALEVDPSTTKEAAKVYEIVDLVFITIYTIEFILKNYVDYQGYWENNYNRFDAVILLFSFLSMGNIFKSQGNFSVFRILRTFRALRAFRGISFIRSLQVIVTALIKTLSTIFNLILLLILFIFVFGIVGLNFFGEQSQTKEDWGSLGSSMFTLFIFVTADNWGDIQDKMDEAVGRSSRIMTVFFIFFGNLIFTNLFIGIVIQNLDEATEEDKRIQRLKRQKVIARKKAFILERQQRDLQKLLERQKISPNSDIQQLLVDMVGRLRHDDLVPMTNLGCNLTWMDLYANCLNHQENTMYRCQQLHFEIATSLAEFVERQYQLHRTVETQENNDTVR